MITTYLSTLVTNKPLHTIWVSSQIILPSLFSWCSNHFSAEIVKIVKIVKMVQIMTIMKIVNL